MKAVIQRVSEASVKVEGKIVGEISNGLLLLIGIDELDEISDADWLVQKILNLRIFGDEEGKLNLLLRDQCNIINCVKFYINSIFCDEINITRFNVIVSLHIV